LYQNESEILKKSYKSSMLAVTTPSYFS